MEMEFMAEFTEGMSRDRARQIIKRKRTKRHRPRSPLAVDTTSGDSTGDGEYCLIDNSFAETEEDEDMANCLIMLAQSVSPVKEEENSYNNSKSDQIIRQRTERLTLSSRRLSEISGGSKSGLYVYECKTCNRTFPSFQALGGHRASHKKPKVNVEEKKSSSVHNINNIINNPPPLMNMYVEEDQDQDHEQRVVTEDEENKASIIVTNNVQLQQTGIVINNSSSNTKGKVHECSICGSEFLSGQALGGHMRKHRPIPPPSGNRTVISPDQIIVEKSPARSSSNMLSLDLNFPPPEVADDHHRQSKFQFTAGSSSSSQQQQHLVFSAPAFVDCHY